MNRRTSSLIACSFFPTTISAGWTLIHTTYLKLSNADVALTRETVKLARCGDLTDPRPTRDTGRTVCTPHAAILLTLCSRQRIPWL